MRMQRATDEELLGALTDLAEELGRTPKAGEMQSEGPHHPSTYHRRFGSWNEALERAGLKINQRRVDSDSAEDELTEALRELADGDTAPTTAEMEERGRYSAVTYYNHFGSWNEAVDAAGFEPNHRNGDRVEKQCEVCCDSFSVTRSDEDQRFCSMECFGEYRTGQFTGDDHPLYSERAEVECDTCGNGLMRLPHRVEDQDHHFCSRKCESKWRGELWEGESNPRWSDGPRGYGEGWNETTKERVRERYGRRCQSCGMDGEEHFEKWGGRLAVHHVMPASKFSQEEGEECNDPENLIPLCRTCHNRWEGIELKPMLLEA